MTAPINIVNILEGFLSTSDALRREAQSWLETADLQTVLLELLKALETSPDVDIRGLAAVLLKSRINADRTPANITSITGNSTIAGYASFIRNEIASRVLERMANESDHTVRNRLSSTIAVIADFCFPEGNEWTELWQLIGQWLSRRNSESPNAPEDVIYRVTALSLLNRLAEMPSTLNLLEQHVQVFIEFLSQSLGRTTLFEEKRAAFEVIAAIDQGISSSNIELHVIAKALNPKWKPVSHFTALKKMLRNFVPLTLDALQEVVHQCTSGAQDEELRILLNVVAEITDADPLFWAYSIEDMFQLMSGIVLETTIGFQLRQSALRIIIRTAAGHLRKATSVGSGRKDLAREQVEMIASSVCGIIQKLVLHATSFVESEEEWMTHREDEPIDSESDDILDALCSLMGEYLHDAASPVADEHVLRLAVSLSTSASPISSIIGLRLLIQLVAERPSSIQSSADSILTQLIASLNHSGENSRPIDMRGRWWMLMLLCDLFSAFGPSLQLTRPTESLSCLINVVRSDPIIRCKCRAMTALYAFLSPLEDEPAQDMIKSFIDPFVKEVIVPAIQSNDEQLQELGFGLATALVGVAGNSFLKYYNECLSVVMQVLDNSRQARKSHDNLDPKMAFHLCDASIGLATKLIQAAEHETCDQKLPLPCKTSSEVLDQLPSLCEAFIDVMVALVKVEGEGTGGTLPTVLRGITVLARALERGFAPYLPLYAECLFHILEQVDAAQFSSDGYNLPYGGSEMNTRAALQDLVHGVLSKVVTGKVDCKEESGVTQLCVKGKNGEDRVIEFKTQIIDEKVAALESLAEILPVAGEYWIPFIPQTLKLLKTEVCSNYRVVRNAALEALSSLLWSLLPNDSEATVQRSASKCALATGVISIEDFFYVAVDSMSHLLTLMNQYQTPRAAEVVPTIAELSAAIHEASLFHPIPQNERATKFIQFVFQEFGKRMVVTMEQELVGQTQEQQTVEAAKDVRRATDEDSEENWIEGASSGGDDEEQEDSEGAIYGGIMRSIGSLMKVFDCEECTQLFMTHLNTPFSGLLTLPEVNMAGRAAALCIFGILLQFGSPSIRHPIATEVIPVVILYSHCNNLPKSSAREVQTHNMLREDEKVYDVDVERVQAAAYCLGVIATVAPQVLLAYFESSINVLNQILNHPQAHKDERRPATECAVGALIKIYISNDLRSKVKSIDPTGELFVHLIETWLPLCIDEDESRTIVDVLVDSILQKRIPELIQNPKIRSQLLRFLSEVSTANKQNPSLVDKDTWTSNKIEAAQRELSCWRIATAVA